MLLHKERKESHYDRMDDIPGNTRIRKQSYHFINTDRASVIKQTTHRFL